MAIENINDLDTAEIRLTEDGSLDDLSIAIYKDDTMNFVNIDDFPVYSKYKIAKKIENFEKEVTRIMQERNLIANDVNITLDKVAETIEKILSGYDEELEPLPQQ